MFLISLDRYLYSSNGLFNNLSIAALATISASLLPVKSFFKRVGMLPLTFLNVTSSHLNGK